MKVKKISVSNFKAIESKEIDFNGCSAIITGGNNKGKTSLLKGLIDRLRSEKPEIIVKDGENKGFNIIELTDGSKIEWNFTEKSEKFSFITKDGIKQTTGVLKSIGEKYFGTSFDIDKFLNSTPQKQSKDLQKLCGLDFTNINERYKTAYDNRTFENRNFQTVVSSKVDKPEEKNLRKPEIIKSELEEQKAENNRQNEAAKTQNTKLSATWKEENDKHLQSIQEFNKQQGVVIANNQEAINYFEAFKDSFEKIEKLCNTLTGDDLALAKIFIENLPEPEEEKQLTQLPEPEYKEPVLIDLTTLETELTESTNFYNTYNYQIEKHNEWIESGKKARIAKDKAEKEVRTIEEEKKQLIESAEMPEGFEFSETGILFNGFPLNSNQISSSQRYIAGLKLGAMVLGKIRTLHFDASFLDKNSLTEVQNWAETNDLQLLIERPDFDGGEIEYKIL